MHIKDLANIITGLKELVDKMEHKNEVIDAAEIKIKYAGYIEREKQLADKMKRLENIEIGENIDYDKLLSLSTESREKLKQIKPRTLGQASRISGVSPADISVLLIYLGR